MNDIERAIRQQEAIVFSSPGHQHLVVSIYKHNVECVVSGLNFDPHLVGGVRAIVCADSEQQYDEDDHEAATPIIDLLLLQSVQILFLLHLSNIQVLLANWGGSWVEELVSSLLLAVEARASIRSTVIWLGAGLTQLIIRHTGIADIEVVVCLAAHVLGVVDVVAADIVIACVVVQISVVALQDISTPQFIIITIIASQLVAVLGVVLKCVRYRWLISLLECVLIRRASTSCSMLLFWKLGAVLTMINKRSIKVVVEAGAGSVEFFGKRGISSIVFRFVVHFFDILMIFIIKIRK